MAGALRAISPVVLAALLASCSATTSSTEAPSPTNPSAGPSQAAASLPASCDLIDGADLASATGLPVGDGAPVDTTLGVRTGCRYDLPGGEWLELIVKPAAIGPGDGEAFIDSLPPDPDSEVHGYGDVGWFGHCDGCPDGTTTSLTVAASPVQFTIALHLTRPAGAQRIAADALGRAIVEHLGL